jgi:hypothetical protein
MKLESGGADVIRANKRPNRQTQRNQKVMANFHEHPPDGHSSHLLATVMRVARIGNHQIFLAMQNRHCEPPDSGQLSSVPP